jgi:hypothetical protein
VVIALVSSWAIGSSLDDAARGLGYRLSNGSVAGLFFGVSAFFLTRWIRASAAFARRQALRLEPTTVPSRPQIGVQSSLGDVQLHPVVAKAVLGLWVDEHFREAVEQAGRAVNEQAQVKLRRQDLSETKLFNEAFSAELPSSGRPRLRFAGNPTSATTANRLRGARAFAEGCYAGIRAVAAHESQVAWSREVALEYIAAFSVLARWVDEAEVYRVD